MVNGFSGSSVISEFLDGKSAMALEKPRLGWISDALFAQSGDERRGFFWIGELGGVCSGIHQQAAVLRDQHRHTVWPHVIKH